MPCLVSGGYSALHAAPRFCLLGLKAHESCLQERTVKHTCRTFSIWVVANGKSNGMENKMENEMETLGPFLGVYRDIGTLP